MNVIDQAPPEQAAVTGAMPRGNEPRSLIAILIANGKITPEGAVTIQRFADQNSISFGEAAVQLGMVSQADLDSALASQFYYPVLTGVAPSVVVAHAAPDHLVDHLRALRAQLLFRWLNDADRRALAITSPGTGEGRSWLAANLAVALAQIGKNTLLIDGDMRNPRQHRLFNISNAGGLSAVLSGRGDSAPAHRIHPDLRLSVVPSGTVPPNPEELLARPLFTLALERFVADYDVVLLDTPPAMPTSDAQLIAAGAGNALIVGRSNHTRRSSMLAVKAALEQARVKVIGSVVNKYSGGGWFG
jgi:receptor protein-tyrosine kinase